MAKLRKDGKPKQSGRPKTITDEWIETVADRMIEWFNVPFDPDNPLSRLWLKDFAHTITSPVTGLPYSWEALLDACKDNEKFSLIKKICKEIQESKLFKCGIVTKSPMAIFAQKQPNIAGWTDRQEHEHTGKDGGPMKVEIEIVNRSDAS